MKSSNPELKRLHKEYSKRERRNGDRNLYSLFNPGHLFTIQQRQRAVINLINHHAVIPLEDLRILETGCGRGEILHEFISFGAMPRHLHGTDLLSFRVVDAHAMLPHLPLTCADGRQLPYRTGSFDLVLQFQVFSSILDDSIKANFACEILRVLKPEGLILWYDFWLNPINPQAKGIRPGEIKALFPTCYFDFRRITLAPPVTRRLAKWAWGACLFLEWLQVFNAYYLVVIKPKF